MGKYDPLGEHLRSLTTNVWRASFTEIESIIGATLPKSARTYPAYWSNGQAHSRAWRDAGWQTEDVDPGGGRVTFRRVDSPSAESKATAPATGGQVTRPDPSPPPPGTQSPDLAWIDRILAELAKSRPVFHSEADFQHALAWALHEEGAERIRLERYYEVIDGYLDLEAQVRELRVAMELKYWTRLLEVEIEGEAFRLKNQAAQPISRYDYLKDVTRLEKLVADQKADIGYAIVLTNNPGYWRESGRDAIDLNFRLHQGRELQGKLTWGERAGPGTTRGREAPIDLTGVYRADWSSYSEVAGMSFRYLALEVGSGEPRL